MGALPSGNVYLLLTLRLNAKRTSYPQILPTRQTFQTLSLAVARMAQSDRRSWWWLSPTPSIHQSVRRMPIEVLQDSMCRTCTIRLPSQRGDSFRVLCIFAEDQIVVPKLVPPTNFRGKEKRSTISCVPSRRAFERNKVIANLKTRHPRAQAKFIVEADSRFTYRRERSVPPSERLIMLFSDKIWTDVDMLHKSKRTLAPKSLYVC